MDLSNLLRKKTDEHQPERFLAIQIQEGLVKTALWQIDASEAQVISVGTLEIWSDIDSLVVAIDTSLAHALESVRLETDPDRVIFGLPEAWIKEDKISPEYSDHLKAVINKLELKPIGFVVITEALVRYLKATEGIPPSIILLELSTSKVNVVVIKLGETVGREEVGRSDDLARDVEEGLARIGVEQLPSRFMIINGTDHEAEQQLTSYPWQDHLSFLHIPKVELPDPKFSIEAIALSGGAEAARSLGINVQDLQEPKHSLALPSTSEEESNLTLPSPDTNLEDFGFVANGDARHAIEPTVEPVTPVVHQPLLRKSRFTLPAFPSNLPSLKLPHFNLSFKSKPWLIALPVVLLLFLVGAFFALAQTSKANIQVTIIPKEISKSIQIAISDTPHPSLPTLMATTDTIEIEKSASQATTGEATVGDKATGSVIIFNKTDSEKILKAGTVLATTSNLKFTLDQGVTVASRSAQEQDGGISIVYGKAEVPVSAATIGTDSNIKSDTTLSVASFPSSSMDAKTTKDFSGGTSRTVQAVSKDDRDSLLAKLTQELKDEAATKMNSSSGSTKVVPAQDLEIIDQKFDKAISEEASELNLTIKGKVSLLKYQEAELNQLIKTQLESEVPPGFIFDPDSSKVEILSPKLNEDGEVTTQVVVAANFLPQIETADFARQLKGKSIPDAKRLLENIDGYQRLTIIITPNLPVIRTRLPLNTSHINLQITPAN